MSPLKLLLVLSAPLLLMNCASKKTASVENMVARMEVKEPIAGVCDNNNVIVILPLPGNKQEKAIGPKTDEEIVSELNETVAFVRNNPNYSDKGMVRIIVNCKGEMVQCVIDNETQNPQLDAEILAVFEKLTVWTPGTVQGKKVDTVNLISFTISEGKFSLS